MRQHVNPLSKNFYDFEKIPSLVEMFYDSKLNLQKVFRLIFQTHGLKIDILKDV